MAELKFTPSDLHDAAVRAAVAAGRLVELRADKEGDAEIWMMRAELDPGRIGGWDSTEPAASVGAATPASDLSAGDAPARDGHSERLIDKRELTGKLGVSLRTLESMIAAGRVPAPIRPNGRLVRWRAVEVESWISEGCPDRASWELMLSASGKADRQRPPQRR